jgi:hypothetical protein
MKFARFSCSVSPTGTAAAFCAALGLGLVLFASNAQARDPLLIHDARTPIGYEVELEPHLVLGTNPPGAGAGSGVGIGARASVVLAPEGFLPRVNDSVAIGFGLDVGHYTGAWAINGYRDQCLHYETGPAGTQICTQVTSNGGTYNYVFVPLVMQWNFWFTQRWSAFAEPGLDLYFLGNHGFDVSPAMYVGGRCQIADRITLTARLGYPTFAFGVSFML